MREGLATAEMDVTKFRPHRLLVGGHAQTVGGFYFRGGLPNYRAAQHIVDLPDGDKIVLHDDVPDQWRPGDWAAVMMHGLAGCHLSPYMIRIAHRLNGLGVRTFRMDLRGAGAGIALARLHYHSGRSEDAAAALEAVGRLAADSPVALLGFSLGGNIALKLVGESAGTTPANLAACIAVSPPIDLAKCSASLSLGVNRWYDRYFVKLLMRSVELRRRLVPDLAHVELAPPPRTLWEFDDRFTAPMAGYKNADDYYSQCSSAQFLHRVQIPTFVLTARNDPMIPPGPFETAARSAAVSIHIEPTGGHLGFVARGPDPRWMDGWVAHRVSDLVKGRFGRI